MRAQRRCRRTAVPVAILALGLGAGCSTPPGPDDTAPVADGAADRSNVGPAADAARKSALDAYAGYLAASREAERSADPLHPELKKYLADPLLTRVRLAIRDAKEHGAMRTGTLRSDPTVTEVNLDAVPPTVAIQDCLDATGYRLVYRKTKAVVPGSENGRFLATATATRYPDGRWLISAGAAHPDQPC
ncbi:hypothetical protein [Micromonospora zhanjiangensis]|uniref:Secreted protein/lipoprotein n=1 Tax=Micromonospora zhanjiangensis TaxID=1522057 RepID=A0ABV8KUM2_9ACTN